ncbi:glycine/D-amino acid oxidase-like deaminating enzyme [Hasllibacter halocynthiae]|uniref:Glycine/D-amino acid oxidase-like deaminating enzyme n=1 Tax=Hasllibacter halocynthiae TaxID=595589 RepID=A0A2T0X6N2_9RHOB|nr:FAD-binding oxidoreductase [Hasllibacter halocynthiae]PRY94612.1 glycine/D-amino acid oxidase-like deaminating enzyme [Hasllibacter halocynthiae]
MWDAPEGDRYDVVIAGGAMMGSSTAWWLSELAPELSVLVLDRDPSFEFASTTRTNSCMRQQFSSELNVRLSRFAAEFVQDLPRFLREDWAPRLRVQSFGYLYLAADEGSAEMLRANAEVQRRCGAATELLTPGQIAERYPFYELDDVALGSINLVNEGCWDGQAVLDAWRRSARGRGAEFARGVVTGIETAGGRVTAALLEDGTRIACGTLVNAVGPRAAALARMVGTELPVAPRKRWTWVFHAETPLDRPLPLTVDPSGVHVRELGGGTYQAGGHPEDDPDVDPDDFAPRDGLFEDHVWPALARRIPLFERIRVTHEWIGHYAYNRFDRNAVAGPHPDVPNFLFLNGFSGHGLQHAPAMGRGTAEWIAHGGYRTLDLSPFHYDRIPEGRPIVERAVI